MIIDHPIIKKKFGKEINMQVIFDYLGFVSAIAILIVFIKVEFFGK